MKKAGIKSNSNYLSSACLCLLMMCVELGNKHQVLGLKLSYWGCLIFAVSILIDGLYGRLVLFSSDFQKRKFQKFLLVWLVYGVIQSIIQFLVGNNPTEGLILIALNVVVGFFLLVNTDSKDKILRYIKTVSVMLTACVLIALWELSTGNHLVEISYPEKYGHLPFATFFNQNDFCTMLCLGIITQVIGIKITDNKTSKLIYLCIAFASGYIAFRTEARASYICLGLFFVLWIGFETFQRFVKFRPAICFIIMAFAGSCMIIIFGGFDTLLYQFDPDRLAIYELNAEFAFRNLIFGYGPDMLANATGYATHNLYLDMIGNYGVIIFGIFFYYTFVCFFKAEDTLIQHKRSFLSAYAIMIPILGCSSSNMQRIRLFWITMVLCFALLEYGGTRHLKKLK